MFARFTWLLIAMVLAAPAAGATTNLVQQIDANTLQIGLVRLEIKERRLTFPASVNMVAGPIEYVAVSAIGKLHESIFKTSAEPIHLHTAAMLLFPEPISTNTAPPVGISVTIADQSRPVEDFIDNTVPEKRLVSDQWRYLGSRLVDGTFIAQRDGSIISIIADPDALAQSGRVTPDDDENWRPRQAMLPPIGTPVKIVLTFAPRAPK